MDEQNKDRTVNKWNIYSFVILSFVNFVVFSIAFKFFDTEVVGFYLLLTSVFLLGGNLDLGFGVSTIKLIASAKAKNDFKYINEYFVTYLTAYILLVIIILVLQYIYFLFTRSFLDLTVINGINVSYIYYLVCLNFIFTFLYNYLRALLEGLFEFIFLSKVSIALNTGLLISSFMIIILKGNFLWFISLNCIASFFIFLIYFYKILTFKDINLKLNNISFILLKENLNYNFKLQFSFFIGNSLDYIIKFLLSIFISIGFVTIYESGKKFITFINGFIYSYQKILFVKISEIKSAGSDDGILVSVITKYSNDSLRMAVIFFAVLNPVICIFLYFWFNNTETVMVFLLLALPFSLISFMISFYNVLIIEGRDHYLITIQTINVILISLLILAGILFLKSTIGLSGYYIATIISMYIIFRYFNKFHNFNFKKFFDQIKIYKIVIINFALLIQIASLYYNLNIFITMILSQIFFTFIFYKDIISFSSTLRLSYLKS